MIEANYAALWGKEALAQIIGWESGGAARWRLCRWGSSARFGTRLSSCSNPGSAATASGSWPPGPARFHAQMTAPSSPFDRFKAIPGLLKMVHIETGQGEGGATRRRRPRREVENTEWLVEFADRAKSVGDTLGFGICEKWTTDTERYQVVGLNHDEGFIALLRRKDTFQDDLDSAVNAVIE